MGVGVALGQLGAEVRFKFEVRSGFAVALLQAGRDGGVVAGVVPAVAVLVHAHPSADGQPDRHQHGDQHGIQADHRITSHAAL